jgi:hypothetical protein
MWLGAKRVETIFCTILSLCFFVIFVTHKAQAGDFVTKLADKVEFNGFVRFIAGYSDNLPDDMHNVLSDGSRHDPFWVNSAGFTRLRFTITGPEVEGWKTRGFVDGDFRGSSGDAAGLRMRQGWTGIKNPDEDWEFFFGQKESILCSMISYRYTLSLEGNIGAGTLYQRSPGIQAFRYLGPYHVAVEIMKASDAGPGTGKLNDSYSDQPSYTLRSGYRGKDFEGWLAFRYDNSDESFTPEDLDKYTNNAGWLFTGEAEWRLKPLALYGTWYVGEGSAYPHVFRQFEDDGGSLQNLILINRKEDETMGAMVGVRSTINKLSLALSAGYMEVEDEDGSWANIVGRDTKEKHVGQVTYRLATKYHLSESFWLGLAFVYSQMSGMPEAEHYKGQSCLMHVNYSF